MCLEITWTQAFTFTNPCQHCYQVLKQAVNIFIKQRFLDTHYTNLNKIYRYMLHI